MLPGAVVLSRTGAAAAADFANATGAPIVGDSDSGQLYWWNGGRPFPINPVSPIPFGAAADGVTNDSAAILAASVFAVANGSYVDFGGKTYLLGSQIALTSAYNGLKWRLSGATLKKGFNGDLVTVTNVDSFAIDGVGVIHGQHGTFTGRGFVLSGTLSQRFYIGPGILTTAFTGPHVEYGSDVGFYSKLMCDMTPEASQATPEMIRVSGPDTSAIQRSFWGSITGHITLVGALATRIRCPLVNYIGLDADCSVTLIDGVSWSNNGIAVTIDGNATVITGCRFAESITLAATMSGAFVGNTRTGGTFTDNTVDGNCTVVHLSKYYAQSGTVALPSFTFTGDTDTGFWRRTANVITLTNNGVDNFEFQGLAMLLGSTSGLRWTDSPTISAAASFPTGLRGGNGAPSAGFGNNGEFYIRGDGTVATNSVIYHKEAGAWIQCVTA